MSTFMNQDRNIVNYARKVVAEKLIMERRQWETLRDTKGHADATALGHELLTEYRQLMINLTAVDLLNVDPSTIRISIVQMTERQRILIDTLSRYLLLELSPEQLESLVEQITHSIIYWSYGASGSKTYDEGEGPEEVVEEKEERSEKETELNDAVYQSLITNIPYVSMVLLSDLHHMTYVASADQCSGILSST